MRRGASLTGGLAVLAALASAVPAGAGMGDSPFRLLASKHEDGPYRAEPLFATVDDPAKPKSFYFKGINKTGHRQRITLTDESFGSGVGDYEIRWFRGENEVTDEATGTGHEFGLRTGRSKIVRVRVKAASPSPDPICVRAHFDVQPDDVGVGGTVSVNSTGACG